MSIDDNLRERLAASEQTHILQGQECSCGWTSTETHYNLALEFNEHRKIAAITQACNDARLDELKRLEEHYETSGDVIFEVRNRRKQLEEGK